ncbi:MAG: hypothetical protein C0417_05595 [Chlorobiaceae bacterium]|nr:hypothetical protein [Chlorobiaceae bacterium]
MKRLYHLVLFALFGLLIVPLLFSVSGIDNFSNVCLASVPEYQFPNNNFPPEGAYITEPGVPVIWANGVLMKNLVQYGLRPTALPPSSGGSQNYICAGSISLDLSFDQGGTWNTYYAEGADQFHLDYLKDSLSYNIHTGEVNSLYISSGTLPAGILIRESPTLQSVGRTIWIPDGDGYKCDSFFDIFFEISTDGGASFMPAQNSIRLSIVSFSKHVPSVAVPSTKFPPNGKYLQNESEVVSYPVGMRVQNFILRDLSHVSYLPNNILQNFSFSASSDFSVSLDGGSTWQIVHSPVSLSIDIANVADSVGVGLYEAEVLSMNISGGSLMAGIMIRESPTLKSRGRLIVDTLVSGYTMSSFFDIFTEVSFDGGGSWSPSTDTLIIQLNYPIPHELITDLMMPATGYKTADGDAIIYPSGIQIRSMLLNNFTASFPPPALGVTNTITFNGTANFEWSLDGGLSWASISSSVGWQVRIYHADDDATASFYEIEILQLNISGGGLPMGVFIRESPTLVSSGRHDIVPTIGGYMISSFFDIFTEITTDAGMTFQTSTNYISCSLKPPCPTVLISPARLSNARVDESYYEEITASGGTPPYSFIISSGTLPPEIILSSKGILSGMPTSISFSTFTVEVTDSNGCVNSLEYSLAVMPVDQITYSDQFPQTGRYHQESENTVSYPVGIAFRKMLLRDLSHVGEPPALYSGQIYTFSATADLELSVDGKLTWTPYYNLPVSIQVNLNHSYDDGEIQNYSVEVLQFNINSLAGILKMRESPTIASKSKILMSQNSDGRWRVDSFFDIFTELSADGGATWSPASNQTLLYFVQPSDAGFSLSNYFPSDSKFRSIQSDYIVFTNGFMLRSLLHGRFTQSFPPPAPGGSQTNSFAGIVEFEISMDGGLTWTSASGGSNENVFVNSGIDDGSARFFDTEMLSMNIAGGTIPMGLQIRESPTKPSTGRCDILLMDTGDYRLCSFFDIYLEISVDGGMSWALANKPLYILMRGTPVNLSVNVNTGWNMVSVPLLVDDYRKETLYPTAKSPAYKYEGTYVAKDTLQNGIGYWIKYSSPQTIDFLGYVNDNDTVEVREGWNMIGSLSVPLLVTDISSIPGGIITSQFFKFEGGYTLADTLLPGFCYWVKVSTSGKLILNSSTLGSMVGRIQIVPTSQQPPPQPGDEKTENVSPIPQRFELGQNHPNPFNPITNFGFRIADFGFVSLKVYDLLGREVATLVNEMKQPGDYKVNWDAANHPSGVYYYRLQAGNLSTRSGQGFTQTKKLILMK